MLTILIGDLIVCDSSQQSWEMECEFATTFGACLWTMDFTCGAEDDATGAITPVSLLVADVWIPLQQTMTYLLCLMTEPVHYVGGGRLYG